MKKLFTIFALMLSVLMVNAQGVIKNNSYFNLQYWQPRSHYGCVKDGTTVAGSQNLHKAYKDYNGAEVSRYAGGLQVGANFYLHPVNWVVKCLGVGLGVDFIDLNGQFYKFKPKNDGEYANSDLGITYSFGVGPVVTITPAKNFFIDLYGKAQPLVGIEYMKLTSGQSTKLSTRESILNAPPSVKSVDEQTGFVYGFNYSAGFNLRYSLIQIGAEWVWGNLVYDWEDWSKETRQNQMVRIKLGFSFE